MYATVQHKMDESENNVTHVAQETLENDVPNPEQPQVNRRVTCPQSQEEPAEFSVQIKQEPELILEPEEFAYPTVNVKETIRNDDELPAEGMLNEYRDLRSQKEFANQPPQPKEEQIEFPVQIKQEPELILEPEELPYPADTVEETITNDDELSADKLGKMRNVASRNKLDPNKCYICNIAFDNAEDVQDHLSKHVDMIPYQCSACTNETGQESKIISLSRLHSHFRMHASAIKCPECPHRTCTRWAMLVHIRTNHEQSDQGECVCEQCGKKFPNKRSLVNHKLAHKALDEGQYPCSYCDKKLSCKQTLIRHERIHTGEKPYQCYACAESFHLCRYLSEHISKIHTKPEHENNDPILTCKFEGCDFSTTKQRQYYHHKAKHALKFQCSQCSQRFPNRQRLENHEYVHTGVKNFLCKQCGKSFLNKQSLDEHVAGHNNGHLYACDMCGKTFVRKHTLKHHLLKHTAKLFLECQHCGMKFKYSASHAKHEKTHMESAVKLDTDVAEETTVLKSEPTDAERMSYECRNLIKPRENEPEAAPKLIPCGIVPRTQEVKNELPVQIKHEPEPFLESQELSGSPVTVAKAETNNAETSAGELPKMRNRNLPNKLDPYKCYICNKLLDTTKDVQIHLSDHGDMIPYQCVSCTMETGQELKITSLNLLHRHFRMHVSSIKCPKCPQRTCTSWSMQRHIRSHHEQSDQLEYICKQCGKKFQNKTSWHTHMLAHKALDEGRFPCSYCDKKLSSERALIRHKRIHTGEKSYQCYACNKRFRFSYYLSEHISNVHKKSEQVNEGTILNCKFEGCDYSATNKRKYFYHKAKHELKFQCTQCLQRFPNGTDLRKHESVHINT